MYSPKAWSHILTSCLSNPYKILISPVFPQLSFFHLRADDKQALLLHLLRNVVKPHEQTVIFVATKHHVEYLKEVRYKQQKSSVKALFVCISLQ